MVEYDWKLIQKNYMLKNLTDEIHELADMNKAKIYQGFFKTGNGDYGEGDIFLGLSMPQQRNIAKKFISLDFENIKILLDNKYHEYRMIGLLILVEKYNDNSYERKNIFDFYLDNLKAVNNWDLVDLSADKIVGHFLYDFGNEYPAYKILLKKLAQSDNLWARRVSIISTYYFIKNNNFDETLNISEILLNDNHDLIHKAVGWMLREIGKRDIKILKDFLNKNYKKMPRTMLRYSIERFDDEERKKYLSGYSSRH